MQTNDVRAERLRRLAELRPADGLVISLYLNLDPTELPTPQARSVAINSLLGEADRQLRDGGGRDHAQQITLREDLARVRGFLTGEEFSAKGAHGMAIFCCGPAKLFEVLKLPRPVASEVRIEDRPYIEPLLDIGAAGRWCVLLVNRRSARILRGTGEQLQETDVIEDEVHRRHDQGGWSQARYQRSIDREAEDHVRHVCETLFRRHQSAPFDRLLLGAPEEQRAEIESTLHPYVRERLAGCIDVDIENATVEEVRRAAAPLMERDEARHERELLDRLKAGFGAAGRSAAGVEDVLGTINERRVETLLVAEGFAAPGMACARCDWLTVSGLSCPVDGEPLEPEEDVIARAAHAALAQSAEVVVVRHNADLGPLGSVAAVLRF